jgi:putative membrane protein
VPWWGGAWGPGPWWIFPIVMPIIFIVVMLVVLTIFRGMFWGSSAWCGSRRPDGDRTSDPALEILRRRFASGEITEQEYEQKRKLLLT